MSKTVRGAALISLALLLFGPSLAPASDGPEVGIQLAEGLWVFDVKIRMPMQSSPATQKMKACIGKEPLTPERLMPWAEKQGCKMRNIKTIEGGITWRLRCKIDGQKSRGRGEFTVNGDRGKGKVKLGIEMGGRSMFIVTKWDARRVGACSSEDTRIFDSELDEDG